MGRTKILIFMTIYLIMKLNSFLKKIGLIYNISPIFLKSTYMVLMLADIAKEINRANISFRENIT